MCVASSSSSSMMSSLRALDNWRPVFLYKFCTRPANKQELCSMAAKPDPATHSSLIYFTLIECHQFGNGRVRAYQRRRSQRRRWQIPILHCGRFKDAREHITIFTQFQHLMRNDSFDRTGHVTWAPAVFHAHKLFNLNADETDKKFHSPIVD